MKSIIKFLKASNLKLAHRFYATNVTNTMAIAHRARLFEEEKQRKVVAKNFQPFVNHF